MKLSPPPPPTPDGGCVRVVCMLFIIPGQELMIMCSLTIIMTLHLISSSISNTILELTSDSSTPLVATTTSATTAALSN
jgi:hypothetical protein